MRRSSELPYVTANGLRKPSSFTLTLKRARARQPVTWLPKVRDGEAGTLGLSEAPVPSRAAQVAEILACHGERRPKLGRRHQSRHSELPSVHVTFGQAIRSRGLP
jgi:hypothetical protein